MTTALFIGRFQPFHKGHLYAIKRLLEKYDMVMIGIGSSDVEESDKNPFTFEERKEMITRALGPGNYQIVPISDHLEDETWVQKITQAVQFDVVVSGNLWVKECFSGTKKVEEPELQEPQKYNGTAIRELMKQGNREWEDLVPKNIIDYIKSLLSKKPRF